MTGSQDKRRIAIVTGAASGIGAAIRIHFEENGISVLAVDRNENGLTPSEHGIPLVADVAAKDSPGVIFDACQAAFGSPDILINNAGRGNAKPLDQTDDDDLDSYIDVNLKSVFRLSRAMVALLDGTPRQIVNISSIFGQVGFPSTAPYSAAKAGVIGLTMQMAADYGCRGLRVNAIAPGLIATPATAGRMATNRRYQMLTVGQIPEGRAGDPREIATVARFLSSDDASYINGQVIAVDGGWTATRYISSDLA